MNIFIILNVIFYSHVALGNFDQLTMKSKLEFHGQEGCPTNSYCDVKQGLSRSKWLKALADFQEKGRIEILEKFRRQYGIPLPVLALHDGKEMKGAPVITWDSDNPYHQKHNPPFLVGEAYINEISLKNKTIKYYDLYSDKLMTKKIHEAPFKLSLAFVWSPSGEVQEFFIPYNERPMSFSTKKIDFLLDYDGNYYALDILKSGQMTVTSSQKFKSKNGAFFQTIDCPPELISHIRKRSDLDKDFPIGVCYMQSQSRDILIVLKSLGSN